MTSYNKYTGKLKGMEFPVHYDQMFERLEENIAKKKIPRFSLAIASALAVFLIAFSVYYSYPVKQADRNDDTLMAYLFEEENINGNLLTAYVFGD